ncbi:uncharacterized protein DFL_000598 [Arthrobotrys flagrans]|uniref:Uncharacterized protein n=1 Tax=Arthrobotrys flagrans TaxID=97331 RepID=A0A437AES2_ARTFL|nr:hypothetical protein DFL_000598 [Arthrobotrys flagrans]
MIIVYLNDYRSLPIWATAMAFKAPQPAQTTTICETDYQKILLKNTALYDLRNCCFTGKPDPLPLDRPLFLLVWGESWALVCLCNANACPLRSSRIV